MAEQRLTAATQAASSPTAVGNKSDATNALTAATEAYKQAAAAAGFSVELLDEQAAGYSPRKDGSSPASELLVGVARKPKFPHHTLIHVCHSIVTEKKPQTLVYTLLKYSYDDTILQPRSPQFFITF